jgi:oxygen-dependent protoporphyrinogen oxidase
MKRIAIIGAGLSGLSLGYLLKKKKYHVDIFEREITAGGYAGSIKANGYLVERGPNSFLDNDPKFLSLIDELGVKRVPASNRSKSRYLYVGKSIHKVPTKPFELLKTNLIGFGEKIELVKKLMGNSGTTKEQETVSEFLDRQFGKVISDKIGRPVIVGIFGGDAKNLSVQDSFPKWIDHEKTHGSLFKGVKAKAGSHPKLFTFPGGTSDLIAALEAKLKGSLHLSERVMGMSANRNVRTPKRFESYDNVIFCGSWAALAQIQTPASQEPDLKLLSQATAPVVSLSLGLKEPSPIQGFGLLIHPDEQFKTMGVLCPSEIFADRAPKDHALLTLIMGGSFHPSLATRPESEIIQTAREELKKLFGKELAIERHWCFKWPEGITQYTTATSSIRHALASKLETNFGLIIHSHAFGGVSVADCIRKSHELAERL